jgi:hypothetical protein
MRTRRFAAGGLATLAVATLLVANPAPSNAQQDLDVVIAAVMSRAGQLAGNEVQGNAVELRNLTAVAFQLQGHSVQVYKATDDLTASITFAAGDVIPAGGSILIEGPNFNATPQDAAIANDPTNRIFQFSLDPGEADAIPDLFAMSFVEPDGDQIDTVATLAGVDVTALNPDLVQSGDVTRELNSSTDPYNAAIRRDIVYTDTDDNLDDLNRRPVYWGDPS